MFARILNAQSNTVSGPQWLFPIENFSPPIMTILDFDRQYPPNFKNTRAIPDFIAFDDLKSERFRVNDFVIAQSYNAWNRTLGPARVGRIISIDIDSIHTTKEFTIAFVDTCTNEVAYDKYSIWNCDRITLYEGDTRALARTHAGVDHDIPVVVKPLSTKLFTRRDEDDEFPMRQ